MSTIQLDVQYNEIVYFLDISNFNVIHVLTLKLANIRLSLLCPGSKGCHSLDMPNHTNLSFIKWPNPFPRTFLN